MSKLLSSTRSVRFWSVVGVLASFMTLLAWGLSSPVGSSPDDDYHLPSIWCGQGARADLCVETTESNSYLVPAKTFSNSACFAFKPNESGHCESSSKLESAPRVNLNQSLYPPIFYFVLSWFATVDVEFSVLMMRAFNAFIAVTLTTLVVALNKPNLRRIPIVTLAVSSVPLGVFVIASTNPSSWALLGTVLLFSSTLGFLTTPKRGHKFALGAMSSVALVLASGSRSDAAIYAIFAMVLAFLLTRSKNTISAIDYVALASWTLIAAAFFSYSSQGLGALGGELGTPATQNTSQIISNLLHLPGLLTGVFGTYGLGWLDTNMPSTVWVSALFVFIAVLFSSIRRFTKRQIIVLLLATTAVFFVPMYLLTVNGLRVGEAVQPRYILPIIALLLSVALFKKSPKSKGIWSSFQLTILGLALAAANGIALHTNIRRYVTGTDVTSLNLDVAVEWWWKGLFISPNLVWLTGSFFFLLFLYSIWKVRKPISL
jgi:hypothetical protein